MSKSGATFPFSRARRLDGPHAYAAVFAYKCWASGQWFQIYARPNVAQGARLGVVVSKRVMKKAVARNYYKRLAREVFRHECARLPGLDFVVRPRLPVDAAASTVARAELVALLQRAAIQCRSRQSANR